MRLEKSCIFLTLRQGAILSITFDMLKITASILLLLIFVVTGEDQSNGLSTQTMSAPQALKDLSTNDQRGPSALQVIVIFVGDALRYSIAGIMGVVMLRKGWSSLYTGTYFWVNFISSFLNVFSALLMVTLSQLPFNDMILSISAFALDQYFCIVLYSLWQQRKEVELYILEHGEPPKSSLDPEIDGSKIRESASSQVDDEEVNDQHVVSEMGSNRNMSSPARDGNENNRSLVSQHSGSENFVISGTGGSTSSVHATGTTNVQSQQVENDLISR